MQFNLLFLTIIIYSISSELTVSQGLKKLHPNNLDSIDTEFRYVSFDDSSIIVKFDRNGNNIIKDSIFLLVSKMPVFEEGSKSIHEFVLKHFIYPREISEMCFVGRVYFELIIEKDGTISNPIVTRSVHPLIDNECLRILKMMPAWKPGYHKGKPRRVLFLLPISFNFE